MRYLRFFYILTSLFLFNTFTSSATHIIGCEIHYQDLGNNKYAIIVKVYRDCSNINNAPFDNPLYLGIYDTTGNIIEEDSIYLPPTDTLANNTNNPCLIAPPDVCVQQAFYTDTLILPPLKGGYNICWQRCCRNASIININDPLNTGASFVSHIPGPYIPVNSDPYFKNFPPTVICADYPFTFDHSAIDVDGDSLVYSLCAPFNGGSQNVAVPRPPGPPPYDSVTYVNPYTSQNPLGGNPILKIDRKTGLMTGTPNALGRFVVGVSVKEYRKGVLLSNHKRDFQFNVTSCSKAVQAVTTPQINNCDNLTISFDNESTSGSSYLWNFGVPGSTTDTSTQKTPTFIYPDTGTYHVKLYVNPNTICSDSANVLVRIYPLQIPKFTAPDTACSGSLIQFTDQSTYSYGKITGWNWNFEDTTANSNQKDPRHAFKWGGNYTVHLTVTNDQGCVDSTTRPIVLLNGPILTVMGDSICLLDTTTIGVIKNPTQKGTFSWSPDYNVIGNNLDTTILKIHPTVTTTYIVTGTSPNGCVNTDSLVVVVFDTVIARVSSDTTVCPGTKAILRGSGGTRFLWSPSTNLSYTNRDSAVFTAGNSQAYTFTTYVGNIAGKCSATKSVTVFVKPVPTISLANEQLCLGDSIKLSPTGAGTQFEWSPDSALSATNIRNPWASPKHDIVYYVAVTDNSGNYCPSGTLHDSIIITVVVDKHSASHDTTIALGTSVQLNAYPNDVIYSWAPSNTVNTSNASNPIATPTQNTTYIVTYTFPDGCQANDTIIVKTDPTPIVVFPNAFTPDGDGHNDIFRPIHFGALTLETFKVYNRWGEVVFETSDLNAGWDGTFKGKLQPIGTYAYYFAGHATETGKKYEKQGNVTLIR